MNAPSIQLRLLVLSEDGGPAQKVLRALLCKAFALLVPGCATNRVQFDPPEESVERITRGNLWKSGNPKDLPQIIALRRAIATRLGEADPPGFVIFHFDGDQRWSQRSQCRYLQQFQARVEEPVRQLLSRWATKSGHSDEEVDARLSRLLPLVPFWSIEAWLYQNQRVAREIEQSNPSESLSAQLIAWEADPASLEEVEKPKDNCALKDHHNLALSQGWPADRVYDLDQSFAVAVNTMLACARLTRALQATLHP